MIPWVTPTSSRANRFPHRCQRGAITPDDLGAAFSPTICARCGRSLVDNHYPPAHPSVARIQAAMLQGKYQGITELEGLGRLTWQEMVSLADVLIGMIWTDLTPAEQQAVFLMYASDPHIQLTDQDAIYDRRHGSLQFLSWLIEDWPDSPGAQVGQSMLLRWLITTFNRLGVICRRCMGRPGARVPPTSIPLFERGWKSWSAPFSDPGLTRPQFAIEAHSSGLWHVVRPLRHTDTCRFPLIMRLDERHY